MFDEHFLKAPTTKGVTAFHVRTKQDDFLWARRLNQSLNDRRLLLAALSATRTSITGSINDSLSRRFRFSCHIPPGTRTNSNFILPPGTMQRTEHRS